MQGQPEKAVNEGNGSEGQEGETSDGKWHETNPGQIKPEQADGSQNPGRLEENELKRETALPGRFNRSLICKAMRDDLRNDAGSARRQR
jgi:hypothetical protein